MEPSKLKRRVFHLRIFIWIIIFIIIGAMAAYAAFNVYLRVYRNNYDAAARILESQSYMEDASEYQKAFDKLQSVKNSRLFTNYLGDSYKGLMLLAGHNYVVSGDESEMEQIKEEVFASAAFSEPEFKYHLRYSTVEAYYMRAVNLDGEINSVNETDKTDKINEISHILSKAIYEIATLDYMNYTNPDMYAIWSELYLLSWKYDNDENKKEQHKANALRALRNGLLYFPTDFNLMIKKSYALYNNWILGDSLDIEKIRSLNTSIEKKFAELADSKKRMDLYHELYADYKQWYKNNENIFAEYDPAV